jgi:hypothetical protein
MKSRMAWSVLRAAAVSQLLGEPVILSLERFDLGCESLDDDEKRAVIHKGETLIGQGDMNKTTVSGMK